MNSEDQYLEVGACFPAVISPDCEDMLNLCTSLFEVNHVQYLKGQQLLAEALQKNFDIGTTNHSEVEFLLNTSQAFKLR